MINTVKIQGNSFLVNDVMSVPNDPRNTDYQAVQEWIVEGNTPEPEFTSEEIEAQRLSDITSEATRIIEATYSPLKQRKMMSIAITLLDKRGLKPLTTSEEALMQEVRDSNDWIADIRDKENEAQNNGTLVGDVVWV